MNVSLIWITRVSELEDEFLQEYINTFDGIDVEKIIVGHTNIADKQFKYIPFYERGIDALGLICQKKNIVVLAATNDICVVMHADITPTKETLLNYNWSNIKSNDIVCPIAVNKQGYIGKTWCSKGSWCSKSPYEPYDTNTYISGACLIGHKKALLETTWDQNLIHNEGEDVEMSDRLHSKGMNIYCDPSLLFNIKFTQ
jgi:hypothetical protein